jgi:environmental stress-induced protein Ves
MVNVILTPLPPSGFRRTPWKNGGGVTIDIADAYRQGAVPGSWAGMIWRLGRTSIVAPGPFSDLTGYERLQVVIAGSGLVLETADGEIGLRRPLRPVRYDGGTPITSRLENGPVEVVNLIADRSICAIELIVPGVGEAIGLGEGTHVVYAPTDAVSGSCGGTAFMVEAGHALRIDAKGSCELSVDSGPALLATISPR